ncbi:hypothetical protein TNCV_3978601 [Trichonephila clavipes]|uniref:Uncharacterized protein n=1 Tax=Trichonephila clavipes TaxID=2585209 RepID=A0A8X6WGI5_TRICX|nr:hypothetical protein TNCV_3978601 [Trichonephila clavipes]
MPTRSKITEKCMESAAPTMQLHFACRQSGSRMNSYTNTELSGMQLAVKPPIVLEELHGGVVRFALPRKENSQPRLLYTIPLEIIKQQILHCGLSET